MKFTKVQLEAKLFKGFADQSRLAILETIFKQPKTVSQIVKETKLSQPNTSTHLACLLDCGLISKERQGREVYYQISTPAALDLIQLARKILKENSKKNL